MISFRLPIDRLGLPWESRTEQMKVNEIKGMVFAWGLEGKFPASICYTTGGQNSRNVKLRARNKKMAIFGGMISGKRKRKWFCTYEIDLEMDIGMKCPRLATRWEIGEGPDFDVQSHTYMWLETFGVNKNDSDCVDFPGTTGWECRGTIPASPKLAMMRGKPTNYKCTQETYTITFERSVDKEKKEKLKTRLTNN